MQNDNNNFNNQNEQPGGFNGQPGPGGYEYGPDEFNTGGFGQPLSGVQAFQGGG